MLFVDIFLEDVLNVWSLHSLTSFAEVISNLYPIYRWLKKQLLNLKTHTQIMFGIYGAKVVECKTSSPRKAMQENEFHMEKDFCAMIIGSFNNSSHAHKLA